MDDKPKSPHKDTNTPNDITQSEKDIPTRIEVENMILKGKSDYLQTLIIVVLTLFALLGAIFPFVSSIYQSDRADRAIDKMETSFKELAGKQLRKPKIECKNGKEFLLNSVFNISGGYNSTSYIQIYNDGDGVAGPIDAYIYFDDPNSRLNYEISTCNHGWNTRSSDEPDYGSKYSVGGCEHLSPQEILDIPLSIEHPIKFECRAMLKVFYGEPTPIKVPFVFRMTD